MTDTTTVVYTALIVFDIIREPIKVTKPIRLIELFAG